MNITNYLDKCRLAALPAPEVNAIARYTHGLCGEFAIALCNLTGWSFVMVVAEDASPIHAMVQRPDGKVVDVRGVQSVDEAAIYWGAHWGPCRLEPADILPWVTWEAEVKIATTYIKTRRPELLSP